MQPVGARAELMTALRRMRCERTSVCQSAMRWRHVDQPAYLTDLKQRTSPQKGDE
jgi:hypothetical protein